MKSAVYAVLAAVIVSSALFGQALSGTVTGTVTDSAGAAIPDTSVILTNEGTQFSRTVITNQNGQYVASAFPTGSITLIVEHPGFQKLVRRGVALTAADTITVDLQLQIGNVQETVQVTGDATLLQTQTAAVSSLVTNQQIIDIPLNGRSFTQLITLMPGVAATNPSLTTGGGYGMRANTAVSINGSQAGNNGFLVDGMYNKGLWLNNLIIVPTIDAIQEVRVMASNYSAEYGDAAGGVTVAQSKSGTNQYHGSLYEFLRNDKLDANTFFNNRGAIAKSAFHRNEFGGTYGGHIRRDKTFFFADYQGIRIVQPSTTTSTIPTVAQRDMIRTGNFAALGAQVFDPFTLVPGANNTQTRAPFAGNQIPLNRIDPIGVKLINLLPAPQTAATTRNYTFQDRTTQRTDQFDTRIDENFGSDRLFLKYSYDNSNRVSPGSLPAPANAGVPIGRYLAGGSTTTFKNWAAAANYTKVIGPNLVNEARLGAVRWNFANLSEGIPYATAAGLGMPGINISDNAGGLPGFTIAGGFATIGDSSTFPEFSRTITYQYEDIITMVKGSHTFKAGGRYLRHIFNGYSAFPVRGTYSFNGQFTRQVGASTATTALSDFALGASDTINRAYFPGVFGIRFFGLAAFAEDTWRVNKRLTLNLGVRYEIQSSPYEVHDRWANFNVVTGRLLIANQNGNSRSVRNLDTNNLGPRLGVTYQLDPKTVIRTGFGMSYTEQFDGGTQLYKNLPFLVSQRITTDQNGTPSTLIKDGLPIPAAPAATDPAINGGNPMAYPLDFKTPKIMQWSFGIQREIFRDLVLETSYVGTRGIALMAKVNTNQPFPGPGARGPRSPLYAVNPLVGDLIYHDNWGGSKYHSLQVRLQSRARHGLSAGLSYTYSHSLINTGQNQGANSAQDARNLRAEWGSDGSDRRHMVVINHVYELPFGHGRPYLAHGLLGQIVGNWNISGVWNMLSGNPFTPRLASGVSNAADTCNGCPAERPNRIADGNLPTDQRTIDRWFDKTAFVPGAQYTFGNAGNNILIGPGYFNLDAGIHRSFRITEQWKAVFRWEMFNAFNHANFSNPNASIGGATAGQISGTSAARSMQLALKLNF